MTSCGGLHMDVIHSFICIRPFSATSLTGLLGCIDESLLSDATGCFTVASAADTSSGYNREIGRLVLPVAVRIFAERIILSFPLFTDSMTASFQLTLFESSWTKTTSLVFTLVIIASHSMSLPQCSKIFTLTNDS